MVGILCWWSLGIPIFSRADLAMVRAQEQFVQAAVPEAKPPEPCDTIAIEALGSRWHAYRALAAKRIRRDTLFDPRWLFWEARVRDPEARMRMLRIATVILRCSLCGGNGCCPMGPLFPGRDFDPDNGEFFTDRCAWCRGFRWNHAVQMGSCRDRQCGHWGECPEPSACSACKGIGWAFGEPWVEF